VNGHGAPGGLVHLGVIVRRLESAEAIYGRLGLRPTERATVDRENLRITFFPAGSAEIELLEPLTRDGPLGRFLAARGEGIHHVALEVPDIEEALVRARAAGVRLIDAVPRAGARGSRIAFLHPEALHGLLVELVERPRDTAR